MRLMQDLLGWLATASGSPALGALAGGAWGAVLALIERQSSERIWMRRVSLLAVALGAVALLLIARATEVSRYAAVCFVPEALVVRALVLLSAGRHQPPRAVRCDAVKPRSQLLPRTTRWGLLLGIAAVTHGVLYGLLRLLRAPEGAALLPDTTILWAIVASLTAFFVIPLFGSLTLEADIARFFEERGFARPFPSHSILTWRGALSRSYPRESAPVDAHPASRTPVNEPDFVGGDFVGWSDSVGSNFVSGDFISGDFSGSDFVSGGDFGGGSGGGHK